MLASHENSSALVLVDADVEGLSVQSFKTLDGQTCGELSFENVSFPFSGLPLAYFAQCTHVGYELRKYAHAPGHTT